MDIQQTENHAGFFHCKEKKTEKKTSTKNIVLYLPALKGTAKYIKNSDQDINSANNKLEVRKSKYTSKQRYLQEINKMELLEQFGLLYFAEVIKDAGISLEKIWSEKFGVAIILNIMTKQIRDYVKMLALR